MHWGRQKAVGGRVKWSRKDVENWSGGWMQGGGDGLSHETKEVVGQV